MEFTEGNLSSLEQTDSSMVLEFFWALIDQSMKGFGSKTESMARDLKFKQIKISILAILFTVSFKVSDNLPGMMELKLTRVNGFKG